MTRNSIAYGSRKSTAQRRCSPDPDLLARIACACLTLVMAAPVFGQQAAADLQEVAAGLQEVLVTAQRREQRLSDVGLSVTTLGADVLVHRGITSASDLSKVVPGFTAGDSSLNVPVYSIRGIGLNESTLAANSTIAIALDEVPLPYTAMTQGSLLDLQRIEVVKGPQGTLYGLNSTGGAINYIGNRPTDAFAAGVQASYGRFDAVTAEAFLGGPLSESARVRVALGTVQSGDWQRNYTRSASMGETNKSSGRVTLNWTPLERLDVDLIASGWVDRSDTAVSQANAFRPQNPMNVGLVPQTFAQPLAPSNARAANWNDEAQLRALAENTAANPGYDYTRDDHFYQLAAKIAIDLTDSVQLTSTTAYSRFVQDAYVDRDGLATRNYHVKLDGDINSFYQELRLTGETGGLNWSAGSNYRDDAIRDDTVTDLGDSTISVAFGLPIPYNVIDTDQEVETYAFFADGEYTFTDVLSVVGGVRYTRDKRDFRGCSADAGDGLSATAFTIGVNFFRAQAGLPPLDTPLQPGDCSTMDKVTLLPGFIYGQLDEDNVAFHAGLNYKPVPESLFYASYSRGFKAGSFPALGAAFAAVGYDPATQEQVDAYEVGFKATLRENTVQLDGAAFYYDYQDKQLRGRITDPAFGSLSKLVNIPESEVYGAELAGAWAPTSGLTLNAAVLYIETEILEFTGIDLNGQVVDFKGSAINYTPEWSVNAGAEYRTRAGSQWDLFMGADLTYRSSTNAFFGDEPDMRIKDYTVIDLRLGVESSDKRWRVNLFGNNVTDTYYWTSANRGSDTIFRYAAKPITYGIQVAWRSN